MDIPFKRPTRRLEDGPDFPRTGTNVMMVGAVIGVASVTLFALYFLILEDWATDALVSGSYDEHWDRVRLADNTLLGAWVTLFIGATLIVDGALLKYRSWRWLSFNAFRRNAMIIGSVASAVFIASLLVTLTLHDGSWETSAEMETRLAVASLSSVLAMTALAVAVACVVNVSLAYQSRRKHGDADER